MEKAWKIGLKTETAYVKYYKLANHGQISGDTVAERLEDAVKRSMLTRDEAEQAKAYDDARYEVILTDDFRSEEHTSELQSLMRISYAVVCLKKKNQQQKT